ncbi:MAG TPA: hypothetical protein VNO14_09750, partial [Blastocatellia bacterium]|nr:hypothetical protein [Blastocatellia bacterium]
QVHTGGPCPLVLPQAPVAVAPGQPEVEPGSTRGIVNALCEVTLNLVNCGFIPTSAILTCDTNGDGVAELMVPLKDVKAVNANLVQATLAPFSEQLPGTPFPLTCCGGTVSLVLKRVLRAGDDNVFGEVVQTATCEIDIGLRAPVVVSVTPSDGDCSLAQNLFIPGSCFIQGNGSPNVTEVFAVERNNPDNVIQATRFVILNPNLIDALFEFGAANAGRTFLIFVNGPNGTSRNLTSLPEGAPEGCPTGNEQGVEVTFACRSQAPPAEPGPQPLPVITACRLNRTAAGAFTLKLVGNFVPGSSITLGGAAPKKVKFKSLDSGANLFSIAVLKGRVCRNLPGQVVVTPPGGAPSNPFQCNETCPAN